MKTGSILLQTFAVILGATAALAAGQDVTYKVGGKKYEGYFVSTQKGAPLVLIVHDWDGLGDYEKKRADMLAEQGYAVFAADLFGAGVRPTEVKDRRQQTEALYQDRAQMRQLLEGALTAAKAEGAAVERAVAAGYCFGGAAILELARAGAELKGFVSFHGGLATPDGQDYGKTQGPILVLHGTADTAVSMQEFAELATQLEKQGVAHEMITYAGAPHAFTVFGSERYREDADRKSWQRFLGFLSETLK